MPDIFIYLIKANLAIVLFYLGYRLLLRKLTFYHLNRFYLLFALLFSALYPLVNIRAWFAEAQVPVSEVIYVLPEWEVASVDQFDPWLYVSILVWSVAVFFGFRFVVRLCSLWHIHRQSSPAQWRLFRYRQVFRRVSPFSFWRTIYLNPQLHGQHELEDIFHHEQVHIDELHTLDVLLAEVFSVLCWFNPGAWFMRHAVRENLEFITDRRVLQSGMDKKAYQYSLLKAGTAQYNPALASNFNLKSIKRRIAMMNSGHSSRLHLSKYLFVIPTIALSVLVFTITKAQQDRLLSGDTGEGMPENAEIGVGMLGLEVESKTEATNLLVDMANDSTALAVLRLDADTDLSRDRVVVRRDTSLSEVRTIRAGGESMQAARGDVTVRLEGVPVATGKPLVVLDGVVRDDITLKRTDPNQIQRIDVLKGSTATALYGDKGKFGVVLITTKTNPAGGTSETIRSTRGAASDSLALSGRGRITRVLVDSARTIHKMNPIVATHVAESDANHKEVVVQGYRIQKTVENNEEETGGLQNVLITVDGKEVAPTEFQALSSDQIQHVTVLKGEAAVEKFGDKAENGAVIIELKK